MLCVPHKFIFTDKLLELVVLVLVLVLVLGIRY